MKTGELIPMTLHLLRPALVDLHLKRAVASLDERVSSDGRWREGTVFLYEEWEQHQGLWFEHNHGPKLIESLAGLARKTPGDRELLTQLEEWQKATDNAKRCMRRWADKSKRTVGRLVDSIRAIEPLGTISLRRHFRDSCISLSRRRRVDEEVMRQAIASFFEVVGRRMADNHTIYAYYLASEAMKRRV